MSGVSDFCRWLLAPQTVVRPVHIPLRRGLELIFLFELFEGRIVEKPHSFIGGGRGSNDRDQKKDRKATDSHKGGTLPPRNGRTKMVFSHPAHDLDPAPNPAASRRIMIRIKIRSRRPAFREEQ